MCNIHIFPGGGQKLTHCRPQTDIERNEKKKFGGISGHSPGMPPSFPSEKKAEGGDGSALFGCAKAGVGSKKNKLCRKEKGIKKITFREVPGRDLHGKAGAVKPPARRHFSMRMARKSGKIPFQSRKSPSKCTIGRSQNEHNLQIVGKDAKKS